MPIIKRTPFRPHIRRRKSKFVVDLGECAHPTFPPYSQQPRPPSPLLPLRRQSTPPYDDPIRIPIPRFYKWKLRALGSGGYGQVYETELPFKVRKDTVAMKVVKLEQYDESSLWNVRAEIEALKRIRKNPHRCLIDQPGEVEDSNLVWWCKENASVYMLFNRYSMDLNALPGLWSYYASFYGVRPVKYVKHIAHQMVQGLNHLHNLGIIHRDIKPDNIFVDNYGHCRIADFGGSLLVTDGYKVPTPVNGRYLCSTFQGALTHPYESPESVVPMIHGAQGRPYYVFNEGVDFWSLGAMLYDLVFEQLDLELPMRSRWEPWHFADLRENMEQKSAFSTHSSFCDTWTPDLKEFILRCCTILPQERIKGEEASKLVENWLCYPSADELPYIIPMEGSSRQYHICHETPRQPGFQNKEFASLYFEMLLEDAAISSVQARKDMDRKITVISSCAKCETEHAEWEHGRVAF